MKSLISTAEILCVGTELLLGDIINTNASFLARELSALGICVYHQSVIGDHEGRLRDALSLALSRSDLVILSGGLGPTYDDMTKETVAAHFGLPLIRDEETLEHIRAYFAGMNRVMTPNNEKQADYPQGARLLQNDWGTAPGIYLEAGEKTLILLPGPPRELEPLFSLRAVPLLRARTDAILVSRNLYIYGMGESAVEAVLKPLMLAGKNPTIAPYCNAGEVRLRVTARAASEEEAQTLCKATVQTIRETTVGPCIYAEADAREGDITLPRVVISTLNSSNLTVSCAESCTGGLIAKMLTDIPGSSAVFMGGCVTYTNEVKTALLGVKKETLDAHTAVSEAVACEMADGIRRRLGTDIGISTTGYAGPGGGTKEEPVGTVYIGVSTSSRTFAFRYSSSPTQTRDYIRTLAAKRALYFILQTAQAQAPQGQAAHETYRSPV